ncbi:MAG: 2-oxoacid:acceptor oxidoreductase family protein [Deltaproteobacteria bacterium]|nr:2-oxoacid:acceptor oxidoreductase family protein [Deltaproteobacteria bacterium]
MLVNSQSGPAAYSSLAGFKVACVDASAIAVKYRLGSAASPIVNTAILGAISAALGLVDFDNISKAIMEEVPLKPEENVAAAREAYESTLLN